MENELDLTLRLGPQPPTFVETQLSLNTLPTDQGINVEGGRRNNNVGAENHGRRQILSVDDGLIDDDEGARNNVDVDVNIRYYNLVFNHFAGVGETLNFAPYPIPPSPASAPVIPAARDFVLIDVPPRRAYRNSLSFGNALDANAAFKQRRGCGGCCGGRVEGLRKCTNINCNAISTPMWRRGPLGPKTLCNACGIKFRKEEERRSKMNW